MEELEEKVQKGKADEKEKKKQRPGSCIYNHLHAFLGILRCIDTAWSPFLPLK